MSLVVEEENIPFNILPDDVRIDLITKGKAKYGEKFLQYDRKTRRVNALRPRDLDLRSGRPVFDIEEKKRKMSKDVQALLEEDAYLRDQLNEMQSLISSVPDLESKLEKLNSEYTDLKLQNDQVMNVVRDTLDGKVYANNDEMLSQLRLAIHKCREQVQSQSERNDSLLQTLRAELESCNESTLRKDTEISSLKNELNESNNKLELMKTAILEVQRQTANCDDMKAALDEKQQEIQRIRSELESLNSDNEILMQNLSQKSVGQDCSVYITQLTQLQRECEAKLLEQSMINKEVIDAVKDEMSVVQFLLEEMKEQNRNLLSINRNLNMKVKDCEESSLSMDMDMLKLENENLLKEIDKKKTQIQQLKNKEKEEIFRYEEELYRQMDEKQKLKEKLTSMKYKNEKLNELSKNLSNQNVLLLNRIQFFSEHFCDLCGVSDDQKDQIADDLAQMYAQHEVHMTELLKLKL